MAHTTLFPAALGMIRLMHTVIKKKTADCFTTRPIPAKAESGLVAMLKVKGYSLWNKHPPACCIEQRPQATPLQGAYCSVLMRPLPARAGSGLLQYNLTNFISTRPLPCVAWELPSTLASWGLGFIKHNTHQK